MSRFNVNSIEEIPFTIEQGLSDFGLYVSSQLFNVYAANGVLFRETFFRVYREEGVALCEYYHVYYDNNDIVRKMICEKEK